MSKFSSLLLVLLVMIIVMSPEPGFAEARPLSIIPEQRYTKFFATLGIACKCCDGRGRACTSTWTGPCSELQCLPWKLH
ncbi:hypothetical protein ACOSP7_029389 [Xanthoceras sorbifolium]|uniref:Uncharacterized protein n=1 Tax=Xanthoceras sorbifolium TaxID=99658 RepID=A0ABQ8HB93_9ROSI|nr:hypothetical protein JRO89_XS12G0052700 [Xanthoceras sorbifolium]